MPYTITKWLSVWAQSTINYRF